MKASAHSQPSQTPDPTRIGVTGLPRGACVLTLDGEMPVEFLTPGDRVITRDSGMAVLRGITARTVRTPAVAIAAGSLGHTRPDADAVLPAAQKVLVRDWRAGALYGAEQALVAAARLADGQYIRELGEIEMTVFVLDFGEGHVVYADGMELDVPARVAEHA